MDLHTVGEPREVGCNYVCWVDNLALTIATQQDQSFRKFTCHVRPGSLGHENGDASTNLPYPIIH